MIGLAIVAGYFAILIITSYIIGKVLELNCFNCSGVYLAPIKPIIEAIESIFFTK